MKLLEELQNIFREVFDDPEIILQPEITATDIYGWDSLSNVSLMLAIENHFRIKISLADQRQFNNVGAIISFIVEKTSKS